MRLPSPAARPGTRSPGACPSILATSRGRGGSTPRSGRTSRGCALLHPPCRPLRWRLQRHELVRPLGRDRGRPAVRRPCRTLAHAPARSVKRTPLAGPLHGDEPSVVGAETPLAPPGADLVALAPTADAIRATDVGDEVTYVVNRNINFTNVCFVNCQFCAFKR